MTKRNEIAAQLHEHLCTHSWHGYTQGSGRNGDGEGFCSLNINGETYRVAQGDRDCSSSVIECWQEALKGTAYEGKLDGATYTGNMRRVFEKSGLFEWRPMSFIAQRGDIYLAEGKHTAMCQTPDPDMLSEFLINERGTITGGKVGDQTGRESLVRGYYDFPWHGILHYNGKADPKKAAPKKSIDQLAQEVLDGKHGNGEARKKSLGAQYAAVQSRVNELVNGTAKGKSVDELAREVIDGKWGNGAQRKQRLTAAGYDYAAVQKRVNQLLS